MNAHRAFGLLVQLQLRLLWRSYLYSRGALLGLVFVLGAGIPGSLRIARVVHHQLATNPAGSGLDLALLGLFTFWLLLPTAVAAMVPTTSDPAQLLTYPTRPQTVGRALAVASLGDPVGVLALPVVITLVRTRGIGTVLPLSILLAVSMLVGQALQLATSALTRSRRFREGLTIAGPVLVIGGTLVAVVRPAHAATVPGFSSLIIPAFLPSALARRAIDGSFLAVVGLVAFVGVGAWLVGVATAARASGKMEPSGGTISGRPFRFGGVIGAMFAKERRLIAREPYFRGTLARSGVALLLVAAGVLQPPNGPIELAPTLGTSVVVYLALWLLQHLCNPWGTEAAAGWWPWMLPGARAKWLIGKNVALAPLVLGTLAVVVLEYAALARAPVALIVRLCELGLCWSIGAFGLGNLTGTWLPFPVLGRTARNGSGQTFGVGMLYLGVGLAAGYLCALPLPLVGTSAVYALSIVVAGRRAERHEPTLVERLDG